jgi:hypothetical protein
MDISIQYNRKPYSFKIRPGSTVSQLMDLISETLKVTSTDQTLIFKGEKICRTDSPLSDFKIGNKAKLMLVVPEGPKSAPTKVEVSGPRPHFALAAEDLRNPPHNAIIARGPPPGAGKSFVAKMNVMPKEPIVVYDQTGAVVNFSLESDAIWVQGGTAELGMRLFFQEVKNAGVQEMASAGRYFALWIVTGSEKYWFYFIPYQYGELIPQIINAGH